MEAALLTEAFEAHRRLLWSLSYRMTGSPADAEDVVQETYLRALERPPRDETAPLKPWLVAVAANLAKDLLRRRRSQAYPGIWLPGPAPLEEELPVAPLSRRASTSWRAAPTPSSSPWRSSRPSSARSSCSARSSTTPWRRRRRPWG